MYPCIHVCVYILTEMYLCVCLWPSAASCAHSVAARIGTALFRCVCICTARGYIYIYIYIYTLCMHVCVYIFTEMYLCICLWLRAASCAHNAVARNRNSAV